MEDEIRTITFKNKIDFSKSKTYTNLDAFEFDQNLEIPVENLYNLESTDTRQVGILKKLSLTIGKFLKQNH